MSPRTGRPKSENPKSVETRIRMDKATADTLAWCAQKKSTTKSDVIREGIDLVRKQIEGQNE